MRPMEEEGEEKAIKGGEEVCLLDMCSGEPRPHRDGSPVHKMGREQLTAWRGKERLRVGGRNGITSTRATNHNDQYLRWCLEFGG